MLQELFILTSLYLSTNIWSTVFWSIPLIMYWAIDYYVYLVINQETYISCELDMEDDDSEMTDELRAVLTRYSIKECVNAYNQSMLKTRSYIKKFYKVCKYIARPFEIIYVKRGKYEIAPTVYKADTIVKMFILKSLLIIWSLRITQWVVKKVTKWIMRKLIPYLINIIHSSGEFTKKEKRNLTNTLNKTNDDKVSEDALKSSIELLCNKINFDKKNVASKSNKNGPKIDDKLD